MYGNIPFAIGNKTIEIGDQVFDLGRLTTDTLNIPDEEIQKWITLGDSLDEDMAQYGRDHDILHWRQSCKKLAQLDRRMCVFPLFRCIRTNDGILSEFAAFLKDLNPPEDMAEDIWLWLDMDDIPYPRLCCYHNLREIWNLYRKHVEVIRSMVSDLVTFNRTIHTFITEYLLSLDVLTSRTYAKALHDFTVQPHHNDDGQTGSELIREVGFHLLGDQMAVGYLPRETKDGSGEYLIYEEYATTDLRTLLKADFYHALMVGYTIRRCECCGRYFLQKKAYKTKYCDQPNPDNPKYTCAQIGRRRRGIKELRKDDPKSRALVRCLDRIDRDLSRGCITEADRETLRKKANDLFTSALRNSRMTADAFDKSLQSKALYPLCGVVRKSKPRGRPKKDPAS